LILEHAVLPSEAFIFTYLNESLYYSEFSFKLHLNKAAGQVQKVPAEWELKIEDREALWGFNLI